MNGLLMKADISLDSHEIWYLGTSNFENTLL